MRFLFLAMVVAWCGMGCVRVPAARFREQVQETERWQRQYEEERARSEALALRLAAVEAALEQLALERAEAERSQKELRQALARSEAERHSLEETNEQLLARQRELTALHEELSSVWYNSALSRARRHSPPPEPVKGNAGGGGGASP